MNKFRMNIDGKEVFGLPGQTILEIASVRSPGRLCSTM